MGPRAGRAVGDILRRESVSCVVSAGFAGGARRGFRNGDLVLASEVIEESSGRRLKPSVEPEGLIPGASLGPFVTVEHPLVTSFDKRQRGDQWGALAVEMETSSIASAAVEAGVSWMALRAVLDPMEEPLAVSSVRQGMVLMAQPWRWPQMAQFMDGVQRAGESLAQGLEQLVAALESQHERQTRRAGWISRKQPS